MVEANISYEKKNIKIGSILFALSPLFGIITAIPGIILWYDAFKSLKETAKITAPFEYWKKYIITITAGTVLILLFLIAFLAVVPATESTSLEVHSSYYTTIPYEGDYGDMPPLAAALLITLIGVFVITWFFSVYFFGKTLSSLGSAFNVEHFNKAATTWYIMQYGSILWLPLSIIIIGLIILIGLLVAFIYYIISASSEIPDTIDLDAIAPADNNLPIY